MELGISYPTLHWTYDAKFPRIRQSYDPIKTLALCVCVCVSLSLLLSPLWFLCGLGVTRGVSAVGAALGEHGGVWKRSGQTHAKI